MNNPISEAFACILLGCLFPLIVVGFVVLVIAEASLAVVEA